VGAINEKSLLDMQVDYPLLHAYTVSSGPRQLP